VFIFKNLNQLAKISPTGDFTHLRYHYLYGDALKGCCEMVRSGGQKIKKARRGEPFL
jgi:hypothetical protein